MAARTIRRDTYDVIVVGSGTSGLVCASLLAQLRGLRVLVLEQHDRPGGCLHTFTSGGFQFATGNHYIGRLSADDKALWEFASGTAMCDEAEEVVETFVREDVRVELRRGERAWTHTMGVEAAPVRCMADRMWWIAAVKVMPWWLARAVWSCFRCRYRRTFESYDDWMASQAVHGARNWRMQEGDWGGGDVPAVVGACVTRHYMEGTSTIAPDAVRRMCRKVKDKGGSVVVECPVTRIVTSGGSVVGVECTPRGGSRIVRAPVVVSAVGALNTCRLVKLPHLERVAREIGNSCGHVSVFIGLRGSRADAGLPSSTIWIRKGGEYAFVSTREHEHDGNGVLTSVHVISECPYVARSASDYDIFKAHRTSRLLDLFYSEFPRARRLQDIVTAGTPVTTERFIGTPASYGLACTRRRFDNYRSVRTLRPETGVRGLFLTGQDILMMGIASALSTALMTCRQVMGITLFDTLRGNDVLDRIKNN